MTPAFVYVWVCMHMSPGPEDTEEGTSSSDAGGTGSWKLLNIDAKEPNFGPLKEQEKFLPADYGPSSSFFKNCK